MIPIQAMITNILSKETEYRKTVSRFMLKLGNKMRVNKTYGLSGPNEHPLFSGYVQVVVV